MGRVKAVVRVTECRPDENASEVLYVRQRTYAAFRSCYRDR